MPAIPPVPGEAEMSYYRIDPGGVLRVLESTEGAALQIGTLVTPLDGWLELALTGTENCPPIVAAVRSLAEVQHELLQAIGTRVGAALHGTSQATVAYAEGDETMAQTYQSNAAVLAAAPTVAPPRSGGLVAE